MGVFMLKRLPVFLMLCSVSLRSQAMSQLAITGLNSPVGNNAVSVLAVAMGNRFPSLTRGFSSKLETHLNTEKKKIRNEALDFVVSAEDKCLKVVGENREILENLVNRFKNDDKMSLLFEGHYEKCGEDHSSVKRARELLRNVGCEPRLFWQKKGVDFFEVRTACNAYSGKYASILLIKHPSNVDNSKTLGKNEIDGIGFDWSICHESSHFVNRDFVRRTALRLLARNRDDAMQVDTTMRKAHELRADIWGLTHMDKLENPLSDYYINNPNSRSAYYRTGEELNYIFEAFLGRMRLASSKDLDQK